MVLVAVKSDDETQAPEHVNWGIVINQRLHVPSHCATTLVD